MNTKIPHDQPKLVVPDTLVLPDVEKIRLGNGIPVFLLREGLQELVRIDFVFRAGRWYESRSLVAAATNALLNEGTTRYTSKQLAEALDYYGAYLQFYAEADRAGVILFCLAKFLDKTLPYVREILRDSVFPEHEITLHLDHSRQQFMINSERVSFLAKQAFMNTIFGTRHPYGRPVVKSDFDHVGRPDLVNHYQSCYGTRELTILVAGQWTASMPGLLEEHFGSTDWNHGHQGTEGPHSYDVPDIPKRHVVEKKDALQSAIRIGKPTINRMHPDYTGLRIATTILGGYFGSRLMKNIREDKGYTYGIGAQLVSFEQGGYFAVTSEVGSQVSRQAIKEVEYEMRTLCDTRIPEAELQLVRNYMLGNWMRLFDGPMVSAETYRVLTDYQLDDTYFQKAFDELKHMNGERIQSLARAYLDPEEMTEVIAGIY